MRKAMSMLIASATIIVGVTGISIAAAILARPVLQDTATEYRFDDDPVVRVVVTDDGSALGIEFTPEASEMLSSLTCEQKMLVAGTLSKLWSVRSIEPYTEVTLWSAGGGTITAAGRDPANGRIFCNADGGLSITPAPR